MKFKPDHVCRTLSKQEADEIQKILRFKFPKFETLKLTVGFMAASINAGIWCFMFPSEWLGIKTDLSSPEYEPVDVVDQGVCINYPELQHVVFKI